MAILKNVKSSFPNTNFVINWVDEKLWEVFKNESENIDWTDHVINWGLFINIIRPGYENRESLTLMFDDDMKELVFYNSIINEWSGVPARLVISEKPIKEDVKMATVKAQKTPEELIEQLEKEKDELQNEIKKQKAYNDYKKMGQDIALMIYGLQDAGLSREEAVIVISGALAGRR